MFLIDGNRYWGEPKQPEKPREDWFYAPYRQAKSTDIEQTAYGLMASIGKDDKSKAINNIDIVRWLSQQRNSLGGWSSTQVSTIILNLNACFITSIMYSLNMFLHLHLVKIGSYILIAIFFT